MAKKAKKIDSYLKLQIPAGKAKPSPPVGPALGQRGVNIMEFCKAFNTETANMDPAIPVPVVITIYSDRSFSFIIKSPPTSFLLKQAASVEKGSMTTGKHYVGKITKVQLKEIAEKKMADLNAFNIESAISMVAGSSRSMGLEIVE